MPEPTGAHTNGIIHNNTHPPSMTQAEPTPASSSTLASTSANNQNHNHDLSSPDDTPEVPPLRETVRNLHTKLQSFLTESHPPDSLLSRTQTQTRTSLSTIRTALSRYKLRELSLSYNGGKDCLVLLILFLASLHPLPDDGGLDCIPAIYALPPDPFPAVEDFVRWSMRNYHLDVKKYTTSPPASTLRSSFEDYLSHQPGIKAIFVGTRRTDPHGANLASFDRTNRGWPDFVRINPVLDWHYAEIWAFIRHLGLKYCPLYDQGYTSLGGRRDTRPNPNLRRGEDQPYRPAYELTEDVEERLGRH